MRLRSAQPLLAGCLGACLLPACGQSRDRSAGGDASGGNGDAVGEQAGEAAAEKGNDGAPLPAYIYAHTSTDLYRMGTGGLGLPGKVEVEHVGPFFPGGLDGGDEQITDLAITPDNRLYGISWNKLWSIDADTGAASFVVDVPGNMNVALTFDKDGTLIGGDKDGRIQRIDPQTGMVTTIGSLGPGYSNSGDIVAIKDGTLFGVADKGPGTTPTSDALIRIDPSNGMATSIGPLGFATVWGLAYWCGKVYGFSASGSIIEVNVATGEGTKIDEEGVQWWGAAVSPLAPSSTAEGCSS